MQYIIKGERVYNNSKLLTKTAIVIINEMCIRFFKRQDNADILWMAWPKM